MEEIKYGVNYYLDNLRKLRDNPRTNNDWFLAVKIHITSASSDGYLTEPEKDEYRDFSSIVKKLRKAPAASSFRKTISEFDMKAAHSALTKAIGQLEKLTQVSNCA